MLPADTQFQTGTPGAESASRGGRRPGVRRRIGDLGPLIVLSTLGVGAVLLVGATLGQGAIFWSILVGILGVGLLWRQADEVQRERWFTQGRMDPVRIVFGSGGWASYARVFVGVGLVVSAFFIIGFHGGSLQDAQLAVLAGGLGVVGLRSSSDPGSSGCPLTWAPSARSASAPRSAPTWPPTCTTRSSRRSP